MKRIVIFLVIIVNSVVVTSCSKLRIGDRPCYVYYDQPAQYMQQAVYGYYRYTGPGNLLPHGVVETTVDVSTGPPEKKWVKKKADKNCLSSNPEDCLVWCLVEQPQELLKVLEVVDTIAVTSFMADTIYKDIVATKAYTEKVEVICDDKITPEIAVAIHDAIDGLGVSTTHIKDRSQISEETYSALYTVQDKNGLPRGDLDIETLSFLGIEWNE
jgi:hypothetical protein